MKREQFRHLVVAVAIELLERVSDRAVMHPPVTLEQAPIGCLLSQRMAKDVYDPVADDALIDEFETIELAEQIFQRPLIPPYGAQQPHRKLPADDRGELQKLF